MRRLIKIEPIDGGHWLSLESDSTHCSASLFSLVMIFSQLQESSRSNPSLVDIAMEFTLRCNVLKCRKEVTSHAVVTTCSHVYCSDCANHLQLASVREGQRPICPACDTILCNPDDAIMTNLNPTDDYKGSVLCGLSPTVIMECATRALNFWAYQTTSEITYQSYLAKSLTDKCNILNNQIDKVVHDANTEISSLQAVVSNMQVDQEGLLRKNEETANALREKNRKLLQTQELYDKLKRRAMLSNVQDAASDEVDNAIQASAMANHFVDKVGNQSMRPPPPLFSGQPNTGFQRMGANSHGGMAAQLRRTEDAGWNGFGSQSTSNRKTPSSHRQTLSTLQGLGLGIQHPGVSATPQTLNRVSPRMPLASINGNNPGPSGFAGYGMSAGLKVSNSSGIARNGSARPLMKPRVAQRNGPPNYPTIQNPAYDHPSNTNMFNNRNNFY
ncbi:hypothetical protein VTL71DRAFT_13397 [Oculimacula yallundae]|uniref:RING-type domain-containing protein n=1 Tax=Oculimacula yallundae TaxID=86028 RepID=A0ABR4CLQ7_9HELO